MGCTLLNKKRRHLEIYAVHIKNDYCYEAHKMEPHNGEILCYSELNGRVVNLLSLYIMRSTLGHFTTESGRFNDQLLL